jgi:hypothetical protein
MLAPLEELFMVRLDAATIVLAFPLDNVLRPDSLDLPSALQAAGLNFIFPVSLNNTMGKGKWRQCIWHGAGEFRSDGLAYAIPFCRACHRVTNVCNRKA